MTLALEGKLTFSIIYSITVNDGSALLQTLLTGKALLYVIRQQLSKGKDRNETVRNTGISVE